jgi:ParB-like chromosome segregation protein Spo0J
VAVADLTVKTVPIDSITPHPSNPRRGDVATIKESLSTHGQYVPIVVQASTGFIVKGNHTHRGAKELGWTQIDAVFLDVDDEQAARIMVVDNRSSDVASNDDELLRGILVDLAATDAGLVGTGYDDDDLAKLLADLERTPPPEFPPLDGHTDYRCPACGHEWRGSPTP